MTLSEEERQDYQTMLVHTDKAMEAMDSVVRMYEKLENQGTISAILDEAEAKSGIIVKDEDGNRYPSLEMLSVLKAMKFTREFKQ
jgi:hypothetical protein